MEQRATSTSGDYHFITRWRVEGSREEVADGDFRGEGRWTFTQDGPWLEAVYDWRIRAEKPLLRRSEMTG